jgi:hypothetical protein
MQRGLPDPRWLAAARNRLEVANGMSGLQRFEAAAEQLDDAWTALARAFAGRPGPSDDDGEAEVRPAEAAPATGEERSTADDEPPGPDGEPAAPPSDDSELPPLADLVAELCGSSRAGRWRESFESIRSAAARRGTPEALTRYPTFGERRRLRRAVDQQIVLLERALRVAKGRLDTRPLYLKPPALAGAALALVALVAFVLTRPPRPVAADAPPPPEPVGDDSGGSPPPSDLPPVVEVTLGSLSSARQVGSDWRTEGNLVFGERGLITFDRVWKPRRVSLSADNNDTYKLDFRLAGEPVGSMEVALPPVPSGGLSVAELEIPAAITESGADLVEVSIVQGDGFYAIGHFLLTE